MNKKLNKYLGYVFFKQKENDSFEIIKIIDINGDNVVIKDLDTGKVNTTAFESLKGYTPIEPMGFVSFAKVRTGDYNDIIVSLYRLLDIKLDMNEPFAICRQSVNDFFYDMIRNENEGIAGICCSRENCPVGIPYESLAYCDDVIDFKIVNFYLTDTVEDVLSCINTKVYDRVLEKLYTEHMKAVNPAYIKSSDKQQSHRGWCRTLKKLLVENNFISDMDTLRGITSVDFPIKDYIVVEKCEDVDVTFINDELKTFFSIVYKIGINNAIAIEFDYDIDLAEFNNSRYFIIRDSENKTYIIQYTCEKEYREEELKEKANKLSGIDKLRLSFYNKYK